MTPWYAALVPVTLALLSGCASVDTDGGMQPDPNGGRSVLVHTDIRPGRHGEMFTEGALPEIRLVDTAGKLHQPLKDHRATAGFTALPSGVYRVRAAVRPCDGNCGHLDGPTLRCAGQIRVDGAEELWVRWTIGRGCRVSGA